MTEEIEEILAIMAVSHKDFANAYQLCKVLSWKFGIIDCSAIIERICNKGYVKVSFPGSKTLEYFALTPEGEKKLSEEKHGLVEYLKEQFPTQAEFVAALGA